MADFTIDLAKTYFRQLNDDSNPEADYDTYLTNALNPAINHFKSSSNGVGSTSYKFFKNTPLEIPIISDSAESTTTHSFVYDNSLSSIQEGDIIILDNSVREVLLSEDTSTTGQGKITVEGSYSDSDTTFRLESVKSMESFFAWLVVYYFFDTAHDLLIGEILAESKQFGDGTIISPEEQLKKKRDQILNNANNDKASIGDLITIDTKIEVPERI